ncbi:Reticulon-like protein [Dermatophagoides pteronyssinus]|uniref:Reticulon-like protein n=1 Tax=Dermatophagoides pteronyssinus TaxID=6956 RepID=A0ABQ8JVH2_DERPT|nr:Reticulon-like protein [Dermatophagoides pteronyssinus]
MLLLIFRYLIFENHTNKSSDNNFGETFNQTTKILKQTIVGSSSTNEPGESANFFELDSNFSIMNINDGKKQEEKFIDNDNQAKVMNLNVIDEVILDPVELKQTNPAAVLFEEKSNDNDLKKSQQQADYSLEIQDDITNILDEKFDLLEMSNSQISDNNNLDSMNELQNEQIPIMMMNSSSVEIASESLPSEIMDLQPKSINQTDNSVVSMDSSVVVEQQQQPTFQGSASDSSHESQKSFIEKFDDSNVADMDFPATTATTNITEQQIIPPIEVDRSSNILEQQQQQPSSVATSFIESEDSRILPVQSSIDQSSLMAGDSMNLSSTFKVSEIVDIPQDSRTEFVEPLIVDETIDSGEKLVEKLVDPFDTMATTISSNTVQSSEQQQKPVPENNPNVDSNEISEVSEKQVVPMDDNVENNFGAASTTFNPLPDNNDNLLSEPEEQLSSSLLLSSSNVLSANIDDHHSFEPKEIETTTTTASCKQQQQPEQQESDSSELIFQESLSSESPAIEPVFEQKQKQQEKSLKKEQQILVENEQKIMGRKNFRQYSSDNSSAANNLEPDCLQNFIQSLFGPCAADILYWRDPKNSGAVFGIGLVILFSLTIFSVISVVAYTLLFTLLATLSFRVYKNVMQAVNKTDDGHPFKEYLEVDLTPNQERAHEIADQILSHFNCFVNRMRSVLLVEDYVESFKYLFMFWALTFIGSWFNGMTLVILAYIGAFSLPKVYEMNQAQVDHYISMVVSKINEITEKIPFLKKATAAVAEKKDN